MTDNTVVITRHENGFVCIDGVPLPSHRTPLTTQVIDFYGRLMKCHYGNPIAVVPVCPAAGLSVANALLQLQRSIEDEFGMCTYVLDLCKADVSAYIIAYYCPPTQKYYISRIKEVFESPCVYVTAVRGLPSFD